MSFPIDKEVSIHNRSHRNIWGRNETSCEGQSRTIQGSHHISSLLYHFSHAFKCPSLSIFWPSCSPL